jgi:hypothetical protein
MLLRKLSEAQSKMFDEKPEAAMGLHFAQASEMLCLILSGRVLMFPNGEGDEKSNSVAKRLWFNRDAETFSVEEQSRSIERESQLLAELDPVSDKITYLPPTHSSVMGFILNPIGYLPPTPSRPLYIYGQLPFDGRTQANDVFYRCEHWLTSRRVRLRTGEILSGTYGFPESELPFVPTGFAAVGRYALPDLPPACRRYEIRPPVGYTLKCGAAVPLYGQAGGGVEVMFPKKFKNAVVPIPPPTVLQPL